MAELGPDPKTVWIQIPGSFPPPILERLAICQEQGYCSLTLGTISSLALFLPFLLNYDRALEEVIPMLHDLGPLFVKREEHPHSKYQKFSRVILSETVVRLIAYYCIALCI